MNQQKLENLTNQILLMNNEEKLDMLPIVLGLLRASTKRTDEHNQKAIISSLNEAMINIKEYYEQ